MWAGLVPALRIKSWLRCNVTGFFGVLLGIWPSHRRDGTVTAGAGVDVQRWPSHRRDDTVTAGAGVDVQRDVARLHLLRP